MKTFKEHHNHHTIQYLILLLIITTGFFSFSNFSGQPQKQIYIGVLTAVSYAVWGIFHHLYDHDLNWKVVVEYISIALTAVVLLWSLLVFIN